MVSSVRVGVEALPSSLDRFLIALGDQGAEHPIAPDLRPGVVLQKIGLAGVMKPVEQFLVALAQIAGRQAGEVDPAEVAGSETPSLHPEKGHFQMARPVALHAVLGNFRQLAGQQNGFQRPQLGKLGVSHVARPQKPVVVVERQFADGDLRTLDQMTHIVARSGHRADAPALSVDLEGIAHLRVHEKKEPDAPFRNERRQQLIRREGEAHLRRVRSDQHLIFLEDEVHRAGKFRLLLRLGQLWPALKPALLVEPVDEGQPLRRMDARQRHQGAPIGKDGSDMGFPAAVGVALKQRRSDDLQSHAKGSIGGSGKT